MGWGKKLKIERKKERKTLSNCTRTLVQTTWLKRDSLADLVKMQEDKDEDERNAFDEILTG